MKFIKIYGERNTGTTYLSKFINNNIECKILRSRPPLLLRKLQKLIPNNNEYIRNLYFSINRKNLGWKHAYVDANLIKEYGKYRNKLLIITITKNPYSWLLSMFRRPYHSSYDSKKYGREQTFEEFLLHEWTCLKRENSPKTLLQNPIELWNLKNYAYISLSEHTKYKVINIKYENLLKDYKKVLTELATSANLKLASSEVMNAVKSTKGDISNYLDYKKYYLNEEWRRKITNYQFEIINHYLDPLIMEAFNYKLINKQVS